MLIQKMKFLSDAENRGTFFDRISQLFPKRDPRYEVIERAYNDAEDAFRGVYREDGETRYFEHVRAVALLVMVWLRVKDPNLIIASLLHDVVEDCKEWSVNRIEREYNREIALYLEWLSKPPLEKFGGDGEARNHFYHSRFSMAPREFFIIKLSDRLHNLVTLWSCPIAKQERKILETKLHYLPHAEKHIILIHELEEAIAEVEASWKK